MATFSAVGKIPCSSDALIVLAKMADILFFTNLSACVLKSELEELLSSLIMVATSVSLQGSTNILDCEQVQSLMQLHILRKFMGSSFTWF